MKKSILLIIILTAGLFSCKQGSKSKTETPTKEHFNSARNYEYTDATGKRIIIHNSLPKGGIKYTDPNGNVYGYAVFWSRIINETDNALEVKIDFPITSFEISNFPEKYFKVLVPPDTMTPDKIPLISYGLTDVESFLDKNMHRPSSFRRTINPKDSCGLYFIMLIMTGEATGMTRTGLVVKGQDLFYKISRYTSTKPITLIDEKEILCGRINLINLTLQK